MPSWQPPNRPVLLSPDALEWALKHILKYGDTIFLPRAFEYEAIQDQWSEVKPWLLGQDMCRWNPRPLRRFLATKTHYSFRYVTQLDPLENLAFTSLVYMVGPQLEAARVAANLNVVYSWRFDPQPDGEMYSSKYRWAPFTQHCRNLAEARNCKWVMVADIADFFPHIYVHSIERALDTATGRSGEAYCLLRLLRDWNAFVSYGIPVGLAGSRLVAEITINDLDRSLLGAGRKYLRYSDDMRVFCRSEREAYEALEDIAVHLFETHGLTLQPSKTDILPKGDYLERFAVAPERLAIESLTTKLQELIEEAGFEDEYDQELEYDDLPEHIQEEVDRLNLEGLFREQLSADRSDPIIMTFLLRRFGQLDNDAVLDDILDNLEKFRHVVDPVVRYLGSLRSLSDRKRRTVGRKVIQAVLTKCKSRYERACLLSIFTKGREFDNEGRFQRLQRLFPDPETQREIVLALGRAGKDYWFMERRRDYSGMQPWLRRAFLAAFSCVPVDARAPFYRSLREGADILEKAVIKWASRSPFA